MKHVGWIAVFLGALLLVSPFLIAGFVARMISYAWQVGWQAGVKFNDFVLKKIEAAERG